MQKNPKSLELLLSMPTIEVNPEDMVLFLIYLSIFYLFLINFYFYKTPLHYAAKSGYVENVKLLLKHDKISVNPFVAGVLILIWRMPIHECAEFGHLDIIKVFLDDERTDVNALDNVFLIYYMFSFIYKRSFYYIQRTPLHWAADKGHTEVVKLLISNKNVKTNLRDAVLYHFNEISSLAFRISLANL